MAQPIAWSQIEAECGGYRAGYVATFRKYEGQPTDELDKYGRVVKVTAASFARHNGIEAYAFRRWLKDADGVPRVPHVGKNAPPADTRTGQIGRQVAKSPNVSVDDKLGMLQDLMSDKKVVRAWRESRAPEVSEHDAKAAIAFAKNITEPLELASTKLQIPMWVDQIKAVATALTEYEYDADEIRKLRVAHTKLGDELTVQEFRLGLVEA